MILTEQLLAVARAYCAARSLSLARVSTLVFNDGKKLGGIADKGADLSTSKFEAAMAWFSTHWPVGVEWPRAVPRPAVAVGGI